MRPLSESSGFFSFGDPDAAELAVKMVDACGLPEFANHWLYAAGLTNLDVTLGVLDTDSGERRAFRNELGTTFAPIADTAHFRSCSEAASKSSVESSSEPAKGKAPKESEGGGCDSGSTLCLRNGRFEIDLEWAAPGSAMGEANAAAISEDSGYFTFFDPGIVEAVVRIVDGCDFNGRYWLFAGGLTDVATTLRVRDVLHPELDLRIEKPAGVPFASILDPEAFATCP